MAGRLIKIARRGAAFAPMDEVAQATITIEAGLEGDHKGRKFPRRQITILAREAWDDALAELSRAAGHDVLLPWTARRANLLVDGIRLPRARGAVLRIGDVTLEVAGQTKPCHRMDEAYPGLLKALHPHWRGGVTARVLQRGTITLGDTVDIIRAPPDEKPPRLP